MAYVVADAQHEASWCPWQAFVLSPPLLWVATTLIIHHALRNHSFLNKYNIGYKTRRQIALNSNSESNVDSSGSQRTQNSYSKLSLSKFLDTFNQYIATFEF